MHPSRHSSAESRLLGRTLEDYGQTQKVSTRGQLVPLAPTPMTSGSQISNGSFITQPSAVPLSYTQTPIVPAGYNINTDPTYSGTIGADTGYQGTPQTSGNVGPTAGQSWTGGVSGGVVQSPWESIAARAKAAGDSAAAQPGYSEDKLRARQQAEANVYAQAQIEEQQKALALKQAQGHMAQGAGAATLATGDINAKSLPELSMVGRSQERGQLRMDRQAFIEQKRAEGMTDQQIRQELAAQDAQTPPPTTSANATTTPQGSTPAPTTPEAPQAPTSKPQATTPGGANGTPDTGVPPPNPTGNVIRQLAGLETDPLMQIILNAEADKLDLMGNPADPMGQAQFMAGADAQAMAKPYDAIDEILSRARTTAESTDASRKAFLKGQLDRTNAYNAAQQENINNQLAFANDKAVRDQTEANKKLIDSQTIMLALQGGFGSSDGNQQIAEAKLKGEQAIIDLNKEFGFKRADVSLKFTEMHNQAFDNYQQAWLTATDNFESKVSNIDLQGISNQQAKQTALSSAYKSYVTEIKDARKDYATHMTDALKYVQEQHTSMAQAKYEEQKAARDQAWDEYKFGITSNLAALKEANDQIQAAGAAADRDAAAADRQDAKSLTTMNTVTNQLNSRINNDPIIKEALQVRPKYTTLQNVYNSTVEQEKLYAAGKLDKKSMNFSDQVLIGSFNKLTDPSSVVRESEYARSSQGLGLIESIRAKAESIVNGGVLTAEARKELFDVATKLNDSYTQMFNEKAQQYYLQLGQYNANVAPQYQMTPEQFGLPSPTAPLQQYDLEKLAPQGLFPTGNPFEDNPPVTDSKGYQTYNFGNSKVTASPVMISALARADQAFFADTGKHLEVNSSLRTTAQQMQAYEKYKKGEIALAAKPGTSFHEKGMAVDVTNWKKAEPYLIAAGIYPLPKHMRSQDPGHFSIGESPIS